MAKPSAFDALVADFAARLRQALLAELQDNLATLAGRPTRRVRGGGATNPNWPKCPVCGKPAYPHTRPYCREHGQARRKRQARKP